MDANSSFGSLVAREGRSLRPALGAMTITLALVVTTFIPLAAEASAPVALLSGSLSATTADDPAPPAPRDPPTTEPEAPQLPLAAQSPLVQQSPLSPLTSAVSLADGDCAPASLGSWDSGFPVSAVRSSEPSDCHMVTTTTSGTYLLRVDVPLGDWAATATLMEAGTPYISTTHYSNYRGLVWATLKSATDYEIVVTGDPGGSNPVYRVGLYRVADDTGCGTIGSTAWDAAPTQISFPTAAEIVCNNVSSVSDEYLQFSHQSSDEYLHHLVFDSTGATVCDWGWGEDASAPCRTYLGGTLRILSYRELAYSHLANTSADIWASSHLSTVGCSTVPLGSWNAGFPVTSVRSTSHPDCLLVTTTSAGEYVFRADQPSDDWTAWIELYNVDFQGMHARAVSGAPFSGSTSTLQAATTYRMVVSGNPHGSSPVYKLGLYQVLSNTSCGRVSAMGWDAAPTLLSFPTGEEILCNRLAASSGDILQFAQLSADPDLVHQVYDSTGYGVCTLSGLEDNRARRCELYGTAVYRVLSFRQLSNSRLSGSTAALWTTSYTTTEGCTTRLDATVSFAAPRISARRIADQPADCHLLSLPRGSFAQVDAAWSTSDQLSAEIIDAEGGFECSRYDSWRGSLCELRGPAPYRLIVWGPSNTHYEMAVRRVNNPVGCQLIADIGSGIAPRNGILAGSPDQRCFRFIGGKDDQLRFYAKHPTTSSKYYSLGLYRTDGTHVGSAYYAQPDYMWTLPSSGEYIAVVWSDSSSPEPFEFKADCLNPACGPDVLTLTSMSPAQVGSSSEVTLELRGKALSTATRVTLTRGSERIVGTVPKPGADGRSLSVRFALSKTTGSWGIQATNPDNTTASLSNALSVVERQDPEIDIDLTARDVFVAGRTQTVSVTVTNTGNVDALGVPIFLEGFPAGTEIVPDFDLYTTPGPKEDPVLDSFDPAKSTYPGPDNLVGLPLLVNRLRPGEQTQLDFQVTVKERVPFELTASASPCFFDDSKNDDPDSDGWGQQKCLDAIVDVALAFVPGGTCANAVVSAVVEGSRRFVASELPPSSVSAFFGIMDGVACVASFLPGGSVAAGIWKAVSTAAKVGLAGDGCFRPKKRRRQDPVDSVDPNEIVGPNGGGNRRAIRGEGLQRYAIYFENSEEATAPAQEVFIEDNLDPGVFDLTTLRFGNVNFGTHRYIPPLDSTELDDVYDLVDADGLRLDIKASVTPQGEVTWSLTTLDPFTQILPQDPLLGFLPPNKNGVEGQGVLYYDVAFKTPTNGQVIENSASIVFDLNAPIETNTWSNLIDRDIPTARASSPATATGPFTVTWTGQDATSGVEMIDVLVSQDGAPYKIFKTASASGSALFPAEPGHTYAFSAVAFDYAGHQSPRPATPHTTTVLAPGTLGRSGTLTIGGSPTVGQRLTITTRPTWTPQPQVATQWLRDGQPIAGATQDAYQLTAADLAKSVSVRLTATRSGYRPDVVTSASLSVSAAGKGPSSFAITGVAMGLTKVTMKARTSLKAKALTYSLGGTGTSVTWKSSKPKVAKVSKTGKITALRPGKATITATASNGKTAKLAVTVVKNAVKAKGVKVAKVPKKLKVGKSARLAVSPVAAKATLTAMPVFKTLSRAVATVDATGLVTAHKKGTATITVKLAGKTKKVTIRVT
ncbi:MAG: Ig-like domain-containing protein [Micrococcales bacterium]|nr:Ig-like domain-containing protein [Micrococcales bacterium]